VVPGRWTSKNRHEWKIREVPTGYKEKYFLLVVSTVAGCIRRDGAFSVTGSFQNLAG